MFAWSRTFYAKKDDVYYNFERKRDRDDAVLNRGYESVTAAEAYQHYPHIKVPWRKYESIVKGGVK